MLVYGKCEYFIMEMLFVSCVHHVAIYMLRSAGLAVC